MKVRFDSENRQQNVLSGYPYFLKSYLAWRVGGGYPICPEIFYIIHKDPAAH